MDRKTTLLIVLGMILGAVALWGGVRVVKWLTVDTDARADIVQLKAVAVNAQENITEAHADIVQIRADIVLNAEGIATANTNINGLVQVINQNQKRVKNVEEHTGAANPFDAPAPNTRPAIPQDTSGPNSD